MSFALRMRRLREPRDTRDWDIVQEAWDCEIPPRFCPVCRDPLEDNEFSPCVWCRQEGHDDVA